MTTHIAAEFLLGWWLSEPSLTHHPLDSTHLQDTRPSVSSAQFSLNPGMQLKVLNEIPNTVARVCHRGFPAVSCNQSGFSWKVGQPIVGSDDGTHFSHACNFTQGLVQWWKQSSPKYFLKLKLSNVAKTENISSNKVRCLFSHLLVMCLLFLADAASVRGSSSCRPLILRGSHFPAEARLSLSLLLPGWAITKHNTSARTFRFSLLPLSPPLPPPSSSPSDPFLSDRKHPLPPVDSKEQTRSSFQTTLRKNILSPPDKTFSQNTLWTRGNTFFVIVTIFWKQSKYQAIFDMILKKEEERHPGEVCKHFYWWAEQSLGITMCCTPLIHDTIVTHIHTYRPTVSNSYHMHVLNFGPTQS